jgi:hypothetical protein
MEIQVALSTIAEVAMSLAGFIGLLLAIAPTRHDTRQAFFRAAAIVSACFVLVVGTLLPSALLETGLTAQSAFGFSAVFVGIGFMCVGVSLSIAGRKGIFKSAAPIFSMVLRVPSWGLAFFLVLAPILCQGLSMPALLVFACLWFLTVVGAYFLLSILWVIQNQRLAEGGDNYSA